MFIVSIFLLFLSNKIVAAQNSYVYDNHPTFVACPSQTIETPKIITSPLFSEYPPYFYCEYVIKAKPGVHIEVTFTEFSLPKRVNVTGLTAMKTAKLCEDNFLEVKARNLTQTGIRYCGEELKGKQIISEKSTLVLTFQSMPFNEEGKPKQSPKGFTAAIDFKTVTTEEGQKPPCGEIISSDIDFPLSGSELPCNILIGASAVNGKKVVLTMKSKVPKCQFKLALVSKDTKTIVDKQCNDRISIESDIKEIIILSLPDKDIEGPELIFSERIDEDYVTCGGTKHLETRLPTDLGIDLGEGPSVRCLWIIEAPKMTKLITFNTEAMEKSSDFNHMFHMIVSPKYLNDEIMIDEIATNTYRQNHLYTSLPQNYTYTFSDLETEPKTLMMLLVFNQGSRKFSGTVTARDHK